MILGTADGGTAGLPDGVLNGQEYDIFAGSGIGYVELDLGVVRPFLLGVYGTPDGDPRDRQLRGFEVPPKDNSTQWATDMLGHFDRSSAAGGRRDYSCPARLRGVRTRCTREQPLCHWRGSPGDGPRSQDCSLCRMLPYHREPVEYAPGTTSHVGIVTNYSNPGTLVGSAGVRVPGEGARDYRLVHVSGHHAFRPARNGVCAGNPGRGDSQDSQGSVPRNWGILAVDPQSAL